MVTLELIAAQLNLHPKALQRRLSAEHTTFAALVDEVRRNAAERYLRDTTMTLSHPTCELGYAEQSVLTRSCRRWFGTGPASYRPEVQFANLLTSCGHAARPGHARGAGRDGEGFSASRVTAPFSSR